jgi:hypothetical protein
MHDSVRLSVCMIGCLHCTFRLRSRRFCLVVRHVMLFYMMVLLDCLFGQWTIWGLCSTACLVLLHYLMVDAWLLFEGFAWPSASWQLDSLLVLLDCLLALLLLGCRYGPVGQSDAWARLSAWDWWFCSTIRVVLTTGLSDGSAWQSALYCLTLWDFCLTSCSLLLDYLTVMPGCLLLYWWPTWWFSLAVCLLLTGDRSSHIKNLL